MRYSLTWAICVAILVQCSAFELVAQTYPLLPDLCPQDSTLEVHIHEYTDSGLVLFWLDNAVANVGRGPLHLLGDSIISTEPDTVYQALQRIEDDTGFIMHAVGTWVFDTTTGHDHWHYDGFAKYGIYQYINDSTVGDSVVISPKVGFCLVDHTEYDSTKCSCGPIEGVPDTLTFQAIECDSIFTLGQGISVNWFDLYNIRLEGQFIDVTGVDNGVYWLRSVVDPFDSIWQTNQSNDTAEIIVQIISEIDRYEENDSKVSVDTMRIGKPNGSKLTACGMPHRMDSLSIHQGYDFNTFLITPDADWFKFRLTETAGGT